MRFLAGIILVLGLTACEGDFGPGEQLEQAQQKWMKNGPASYVVTVRRTCGECIPEMIGPVRVTVRDGTIASRIYVTSGESVPEGMAPLFPSVAELFLMVAELERQKVYKLGVEYDSELGIPIAISVDFHKDVVDDEMGIHVVEFQPQ
jgi:hypothetical protein